MLRSFFSRVSVTALVLSALSGCGDAASPSEPARDGGASSDVAVAPPKKVHDDTDAAPDVRHTVDAGRGSDAGPGPTDATRAPDVDNGAPSTVYPAPHRAMPQLTNAAHGPVLTTPKVKYVFYPGYPYVSDLETFASRMASATFWPAVTQEYGVGALTVSDAVTLTGQTPPEMIGSIDLGTWVGQQIASGAFGTPDPETIYTLVFPETTTITQPNPVLPSLAPVVSCVAFGGYHDNIAVSLADGGPAQNFAYAVIPTCSAQVDDLTSVISHEWVEAATDPYLTTGGAFTLTGGPDSAYFSVDADHAVWAILGGGEAGDLCEPEGQPAYIHPSDIGYDVQRIWSNKLAAAGHDPCAPNIAGPFANAAPVLSDAITLTSSLIGGTLKTKGIKIPTNGSKTVEVDLYSDGDTGGPFTVSAADALSTYYGSYGLASTLDFAWDRTQGVNGEKLHLTITVTSASILYGVHVFIITSTLGDRQFIWSGLVVDSG